LAFTRAHAHAHARAHARTHHRRPIEHDETAKRRRDESGDVPGTTAGVCGAVPRRSRPTSRVFNDEGGFSDDDDDERDDERDGDGWRRCR
jgi:hypothetical protein